MTDNGPMRVGRNVYAQLTPELKERISAYSGHKIYVGIGPPDDSEEAVTGDVYIDVNSGDIYQMEGS